MRRRFDRFVTGVELTLGRPVRGDELCRVRDAFRRGGTGETRCAMELAGWKGAPIETDHHEQQRPAHECAGLH